MTLRHLHLLGSPVLRQRSAEVAAVDDQVRDLIDDLFETMDAAKGVGLAANQVGVARRVAVVDADGQRFVMVDPVIRSASGQSRAEEGCLSIPELYAEVTRPERIVFEALDREGQPYRLEADGLVARAVQHEIDHLDGILFVDHVSPLKRQLLLARYKKEHRGEDVIRQLKPAEAEP
jgi:peptide deformylase